MKAADLIYRVVTKEPLVVILPSDRLCSAKILCSLRLRLPRASTDAGVRRERQSVERYVRQELGCR